VGNGEKRLSGTRRPDTEHELPFTHQVDKRTLPRALRVDDFSTYRYEAVLLVLQILGNVGFGPDLTHLQGLIFHEYLGFGDILTLFGQSFQADHEIREYRISRTFPVGNVPIRNAISMDKQLAIEQQLNVRDIPVVHSTNTLHL
jgi:hypothetical protein